MHANVITAVLAFGASAMAHTLPVKRNDSESAVHRCGDEVTPDQLKQSLALAEYETNKLTENPALFDNQIEIDTYVHVVSCGTQEPITNEQVKSQMDYLNKSFSQSKVSFNLKDTIYTVNETWAGGNSGLEMKRQLRQGGYDALNLYYVTDAGSSTGLLGHCTMPQADVLEGTDSFVFDGCVLTAQTVPGGSIADYNLGGTTVHHVGHWLHLFHTFEGGCEGTQGFSDVAFQAAPTVGCPTEKVNSCPNRFGSDPIHNFMDWSSDACYESFSVAQTTRMHSSFLKYRKFE